MFHRFFTIVVLFLSLCVSPSNGQQPRLLSGSNISPPVWGVVESPHSPGRYPNVVILHGSFGWRSNYVELAKVLADSGFVALTIDYYAHELTDTVPQPPHGDWRDLQETVRSAVQFLQTLPSTSGRIGLIGFSRGAFLAVSVAASIPEIRAVVDFYGGVQTQYPPIEKQLTNFPPLLILHGEADTLARVRFAHQLKELITAHGGQVEMHLYPNIGHSFFSNFSSPNTDSTVADAFRRMVAFLRRQLNQ